MQPDKVQILVSVVGSFPVSYVAGLRPREQLQFEFEGSVHCLSAWAGLFFSRKFDIAFV